MGSGLDQRDRTRSRLRYVGSFAGARSKTPTCRPGVYRAKSEPQGPLQARGAPGIARCQTAIALFGGESPRPSVTILRPPCHVTVLRFGRLASHFRDGALGRASRRPDVRKKKKRHLRSCSGLRVRSMSGFGRGRSHGKPGKKNTGGALAGLNAEITIVANALLDSRPSSLSQSPPKAECNIMLMNLFVLEPSAWSRSKQSCIS